MNESDYGKVEEIETTAEHHMAALENKQLESMAAILQSLVDGDFSKEAMGAALSSDPGAIKDQGTLKAFVSTCLGAIRETDNVDAAGELFDQAINAVQGYQSRPKITPQKLPDLADIKPREWLIDRLFPAHELTLFTGRGGVGKSRLMLQIVAKLTCGWGGAAWQLKERQPMFSNNQAKKKVVYASWEDDVHEQARRLSQANKKLGWIDYGVFQEQTRFFDMREDDTGPLWGVLPDKSLNTRAALLPAGEELLSMTQEFGADVLVLDPLSAVYADDENIRARVRQFTNHISGWANRNECAVVILGHPPKSESKFSGTTGWEADPRAMWYLEKEKIKDGQAEAARYLFEVEKLSYAPKPERPTFLDLDGGVWIEQDNTQTGAMTNGKETERKGVVDNSDLDEEAKVALDF